MQKLLIRQYLLDGQNLMHSMKLLDYLCLQKRRTGRILMKLQSYLEHLGKTGPMLIKKEILDGDQVQRFLLDLMLINLSLSTEQQQSMIGKVIFLLMKCHTLLILKKDIFQTVITRLLAMNTHIIYPNIGLTQVELLKLIKD